MENQRNLTFYVGEENGEFVAVSKAEPCFCFIAKTRQEAIDTAIRAWDFYLDAMGQHAQPIVQRSVPVKSYRREFTPKEAIYAVA